MERVAVVSSHIVSIGYDPERRILEVEFRGGAVYDYYEVPASEHSGLMNAPSHGRYLREHVRDRYEYHRVR